MTNLFEQEPWERRGTAQTAAAAAVSAAMPVGVITAYWGTTAPTNWLLCDGAAIPAQYATLIALVGANTPNLKGRVVVGIDSAQTEFDTLGETGGSKTHTLSAAEMPIHAHDLNGRPDDATSTGGWFTGVVQTTQAVQQTSTTNAGLSNAHNNLQPYAALSYIIKAA